MSTTDLTVPGSPLYEVFSDASIIYVMIPAFLFVVLSSEGGQGVDDHDRVGKISARDRVTLGSVLGRISDSQDLVVGVIFSGEDRPLAAQAIYDLHRHIEGYQLNGSKYHAWNHKLWAWTWAGILKPMMDVHEQLRGFKSDAQRQDVYTGLLQLGAMFNVKGLPELYTDFEIYWREEWMTWLQNETQAANFILSKLRQPPKPQAIQWLPNFVWQIVTWPIRNLLWAGYLLTASPEIDQVLNIKRTKADLISMRIHKGVWRMIPRFVSAKVVEFYFKQHFKHSIPVWRRHYSKESLAQYDLAVKKAKAEGSPLPERPSQRDTPHIQESSAGCPMGHGKSAGCPMGHSKKAS